MCVCVCVCRLETVYEIAGDFRPTTSGSTKRGKIKLWTEDGMCVLYVHKLMYIHKYKFLNFFAYLQYQYLHIYNVCSMWISQCISHARNALNVATIRRARIVYSQDGLCAGHWLHLSDNPL